MIIIFISQKGKAEFAHGKAIQICPSVPTDAFLNLISKTRWAGLPCSFPRPANWSMGGYYIVDRAGQCAIKSVT